MPLRAPSPTAGRIKPEPIPVGPGFGREEQGEAARRGRALRWCRRPQGSGRYSIYIANYASGNVGPHALIEMDVAASDPARGVVVLVDVAAQAGVSRYTGTEGTGHSPLPQPVPRICLPTLSISGPMARGKDLWGTHPVGPPPPLPVVTLLTPPWHQQGLGMLAEVCASLRPVPPRGPPPCPVSVAVNCR